MSWDRSTIDNDLIDKNAAPTATPLDDGTRSRAMDDAAIAEYAESRSAKEQRCTPLVAYSDGGDFWPTDGYHRFHAYRAGPHDQLR